MTDATLDYLNQCTSFRSLKLDMSSSFTAEALENLIQSSPNLKELAITR